MICYQGGMPAGVRLVYRDLHLGSNNSLARTYEGLARILQTAGFTRSQYSDWISIQPVTIGYTWLTVISLMTLSPPGKFESTLRRLKIHYTPNILLSDLTIPCQLGGAFAPILRGPTPLGLVTQLAPALLPTSAIPIAATFQLPVHTRPSATAQQVVSWRE
jgi:hypothetical protein